MLYLIGGSGGPNLGDELIVLHWIRRYREAGFTDEITVDCKSRPRSNALHNRIQAQDDRPEDSLARYPDRGVRFIRLIKSTSHGTEGVLSDHVERGRRFVRDNLARFRGASEGSHSEDNVDLRRARLIHLVGGGYITGAWPNSGTLLGAGAELSQILDVPVVATGLGIEPFSGPRLGDIARIREALAQFSFVECRDEGSQKSLQLVVRDAITVHGGLDDVFLYPMPPASAERSRAAHLSSFDSHLNHFLKDDGRALNDFLEPYDRRLFWLCNASDEPAYEAMRKHVPDLVGYSNAELLYGPSVLHGDDVMVTSRFHPHLLAARCGMQGYFVAESRFYTSKHQGLLSLGSPFRPLKSALDLRPISEPLVSRIYEMEAHYTARKADVATRIIEFASGKRRVP